MKPKRSVGVIKETFQSYSEDKVPRMAAALSYYTIFSIAPLLVLVIAITGFIIGSNTTIRGQVLTEVQALVGAEGAEIVDTLITNTSRPREGIIATIIGIATLIFGATGVFTQLKDALNTIWEVAPNRDRGIKGMFRERASGFVMILGLGFLLLVSLVISTALSVLKEYFTNLLGDTGAVSLVLNYAIQVIVITFIFAALFKGLPDVELGWDDVMPGALVTTILFLLGQYLISLYMTRASPASVYGAAGSLVVLLLWLYYSAQILFLGAEFTKVYYVRKGHEIIPTAGAHLLTPLERAHQGIPHVDLEPEPERPAELVDREPEQARRVTREREAALLGAVPIPVSGVTVDRTDTEAIRVDRVDDQPVATDHPVEDDHLRAAAEVQPTVEEQPAQEIPPENGEPGSITRTERRDPDRKDYDPSI